MGASIAPFIIQPFLVDIRSGVDKPSAKILDDSNATNFNDEGRQPEVSTARTLPNVGNTYIPVPVQATLAWFDGITSILLSEDGNGSVLSVANFPVFNENRSDIPFIESINISEEITSSWNRTRSVERLDLVCFAYITIGLLVLLTSSLPALMFIYTRSPLCLDDGTKTVPRPDESEILHKKGAHNGKCFKWKLLIILGFVCFLYLFAQSAPRSYLTLFVIKYLRWPVKQGAIINSVVYGALFVGRVFGIFVSVVVRPPTMTMVSVVVTLVAYGLLLFSNVHDVFVWMSAVLSGLSLSVTYASVVLWVSEYTTMTAGIAAFVVLSFNAGGMVGPPIVGLLFDDAPMSMVYITVSAGACVVVVCVVLYVFLQLSDKRHKGRNRDKSAES